MSFEFLAPDAATSFSGSAPALRSPIEWMHRGEAADLGELAGWRVVTGYGAPEREAAACRRAVGVADLSFLGKLELQGASEVVAAIVAELGGGATLELGHAVRHDEIWWCPLTAAQVLVVTPPQSTAALREELERSAAEAGFVSVTELTSALGSNAVVGPLAREAFARATALDLRPDHFPEAAFAPVSVARTPGMILREGEDRFLHLFGTGYSSYVWTVFVDAAEHLGGRAVGIDALGIKAPEVEVGAHA